MLAHRDDYMYIRALELQPVCDCEDGVSVSRRFTTRHNAEKGWDERVDQQTLVVRKVSEPKWTDSDSDVD